MLAILVPLLLAAVAPSADDRSALEETFVEIYEPYTAVSDGVPPWSYPFYSAEVTALIAQWRQLTPAGEVDELSGGDWLCQCQDWDEQGFSATIVSIGMAGDDTAAVDLTIDLGIGGGPEANRPARLILKREEGAWKVDDIVADSFPNGIKQALRETIAALAGERG